MSATRRLPEARTAFADDLLLGALDWRGETVVCVAAGPTARAAELSRARGRARVIVINESWRLAPWADLLYACDPAWWRERRPADADFTGLRVTQDIRAARDYGLRRVRLCRGVDQILTAEPGLLGWGGNSGFHALNIAALARPARIVLVGYDFHATGGLHWHGRHPKGLNNPKETQLARWAGLIDGQAARLAGLGIAVVNASASSALAAYPKRSLAEALAA